MIKLFAIGLCFVACVALSLVFVTLGTALVSDLVGNPPRWLQREVVYVIVPVTAASPPLDLAQFENMNNIEGSLAEINARFQGTYNVIPTSTPVPTSIMPMPVPAAVQPIVMPTLVILPQNVQTQCDPSYPDFCLLPSEFDTYRCQDIPYQAFRVFQPDPHQFDGDRDGIGCE